jgi:F420H(2)-dependent quinone reductase
MGGHVVAYRLTGGVIGHRFPGSPPMLLLDHVGARSGRKRTSPLVYVKDGDNVVIVASKGGYPKHPAWYHNLLANPDTEIQVGSRRRRVRARVATAEERPRLWSKAVETYSGYAGYQERTDREIPLVILEPRPAAPPAATRPPRSHAGEPEPTPRGSGAA